MKTILPSLLIFPIILFFLNPAFSQNPNGLDLDGINDYVQTSFPAMGGNVPRTIEAWIKTTANANPSNGGVQQIITDWGSFVTGGRFTFNVLWSNAIRVEVGGSGLSGSIPVNDGMWHHVAVTYNPSAGSSPFRLYVDGNLDVSGNITTPVNTVVGNMRIGQRVDGARHFDGTIDEVRVWNFVKSQSQIMAELNNELCGTPTGLMVYYNFNQGSAGNSNIGQTTLFDQSGNARNGSLINFALSGSSSNWVSGATLGQASGIFNLRINSCGPYTSPSGNNTWTSSGIYTDTVTSTTGCDSVLNIDLTISSSSTGALNALACDSFISPSGRYTWMSSGNYSDTLVNQSGCDSIISIKLELGRTTFDSSMVISCGPLQSPSGKYLWEDSGTYHDTLISPQGCFSYLVYELTVVELDTTVVLAGDTLSANQSQAQYQWLDCNDSYAIIPNANSPQFVPDSTGLYALEISDGNCIDTSGCHFVEKIFSSVNDHFSGLKVYPNPVTDRLFVDFGTYFEGAKLDLYNFNGHKLKSFLHSGENMEIDFRSLPRGNYLLRIQQNRYTTVLKVLVE
ncbi:MAG: T9SS type A sorting domain-containing protein [Bacteroidia bacterium]|nr:T9SS type A sorting domain-containing protein [Bacteroidia bacterium]